MGHPTERAKAGARRTLESTAAAETQHVDPRIAMSTAKGQIQIAKTAAISLGAIVT
jgi:hypothetical protein